MAERWPGPSRYDPAHPSFSLGGFTRSPTASLCAGRGKGGGGPLWRVRVRDSEHSIFQPALYVETENNPPPQVCFFQLTEVKKQLKGFTHVCLKQTFNEFQRMIPMEPSSYLHNKWFNMALLEIPADSIQSCIDTFWSYQVTVDLRLISVWKKTLRWLRGAKRKSTARSVKSELTR